MVRYQEVPAQNVVLYYVLMEFGNRTCAYLYQVADVLVVVLVRVLATLVSVVVLFLLTVPVVILVVVVVVVALAKTPGGSV